jgi:hypothetical protein
LFLSPEKSRGRAFTGFLILLYCTMNPPAFSTLAGGFVEKVAPRKFYISFAGFTTGEKCPHRFYQSFAWSWFRPGGQCARIKAFPESMKIRA